MSATLEEREPPDSAPSPALLQAKDKRGAFIRYLLDLASPNNAANKDRAAIATLRASLRGTPTDYYRAAQYITRFLSDQPSDNDRWFFLVGGLLALHPADRPGTSFGKALQSLRDESGSTDRRFLSLLNARPSQLPHLLRQMISLLETKGVGLDYRLLLRDLCYWEADDNWVQKSWARDYFRTVSDKKPKGAVDETIPDIDDEIDDDNDEDNS